MGCLGATSYICACRIPISNREYDTYRKTVKVPKGADDVQTAPSKGRAWRAKVKDRSENQRSPLPEAPGQTPEGKATHSTEGKTYCRSIEACNPQNAGEARQGAKGQSAKDRRACEEATGGLRSDLATNGSSCN